MSPHESARSCALGLLGAITVVVALAPEAEGSRPALRLVYTTDTGGQVDTCGCSGGQYGGLCRRASLLKALALDGVPQVVLDGGSVVTSAAQSPYFAEAYAAMGYKLVLPSGADLTAKDADGSELPEALAALGIGVLRRPVADVAEPLPSVALDVAEGWRVLVLAAPEDAVPLPALAARARQAVEGIDRAKMVVLLATRLELGDNQRLAQELGDAVDVIVGASSPAQTRDYRDPIPEGNVVPAISQGKALTVIDVYIEPDGHKRIQARFEPVSPNLLEDPGIKAIVERYYTEAAPASRPAEAPKDTVDYVMRGWADAETCGTCHPKELEAWKGTAHAKAIATLAQAGRLVDECLACHSEEFRQRKVFDPVNLVPGDGVTCATCHGDGLIHSMTGRVDYIRRSMEAADCMACHNEERQPAGFDFAASHEKIRHLPAPAGAAAE